MSLELEIKELNATIRELIAAMQAGAPVKALAYSETDERTVEQVAEVPKVEAVEQEAPAATQEQKVEPAAADEGAQTVTREDVTKVVIALGKAGKRNELIELLGTFGASKGSELGDSDLAAFHAGAAALLEG